MNTSAFLIPLHRQLTLAQPNTTSAALRTLAKVTPEEELMLHHGTDKRLLGEDEEVRLTHGDHLSIHLRHAHITVSINRTSYSFAEQVQTGRAIKERAGIDLADTLFLSILGGDDQIIANDTSIRLKEGMCLFSQPAADYGVVDPPPHGGNDVHHIPITINRKTYKLDSPVQTGGSLKTMAAIVLEDVLFLVIPGGDDTIIANDQQILVKPGSHFFSQPAADYGVISAGIDLGLPITAQILPQADGWAFVILPQQQLHAGYQPHVADFLVKLPPNFPDAAPDMFWVRPSVYLVNGAIPKGASVEHVLNEPWMRFSWHLKPGSWQPGISTFTDFHRCIRARFERGN